MPVINLNFQIHQEIVSSFKVFLFGVSQLVVYLLGNACRVLFKFKKTAFTAFLANTLLLSIESVLFNFIFSLFLVLLVIKLCLFQVTHVEAVTILANEVFYLGQGSLIDIFCLLEFIYKVEQYLAPPSINLFF